MPFPKLVVTFTLTIILVIPILVASPSLGSSMHMKAKISPLLSLSYTEIIGMVGGIVDEILKKYKVKHDDPLPTSLPTERLDSR